MQYKCSGIPLQKYLASPHYYSWLFTKKPRNCTHIIMYISHRYCSGHWKNNSFTPVKAKQSNIFFFISMFKTLLLLMYDISILNVPFLQIVDNIMKIVVILNLHVFTLIMSVFSRSIKAFFLITILNIIAFFKIRKNLCFS